MKLCSISLETREMQIKTTLRFISFQLEVRVAAIKNTNNHKYWRGYSEKGTLLHCWWDCKLVRPQWKSI